MFINQHAHKVRQRQSKRVCVTWTNIGFFCTPTTFLSRYYTFTQGFCSLLLKRYVTWEELKAVNLTVICIIAQTWGLKDTGLFWRLQKHTSSFPKIYFSPAVSQKFLAFCGATKDLSQLTKRAQSCRSILRLKYFYFSSYPLSHCVFPSTRSFESASLLWWLMKGQPCPPRASLFGSAVRAHLAEWNSGTWPMPIKRLLFTCASVPLSFVTLTTCYQVCIAITDLHVPTWYLVVWDIAGSYLLLAYFAISSQWILVE